MAGALADMSVGATLRGELGLGKTRVLVLTEETGWLDTQILLLSVL